MALPADVSAEDMRRWQALSRDELRSKINNREANLC
jgi:hypothetical protein